MPPCPDWSQPESESRLPSVALGMAEVTRFLQKQCKSLIINHGHIRDWHLRVFKDAVPLSYYAGNYRCDNAARPCLGAPVSIGAYAGSDYHLVENEMTFYSSNLHSYIQLTDAHIKIEFSFAKRLTAVFQLASWSVGRFVQIHPFLNGNGRMSRLLANYFFLRYDLDLVPFKTIARPPEGEYAKAMEACMAGSFAPLFQYFLLLYAAQTSS
jgi:fido (protein-threonine AMPylation protein)